MSRLRIEVPAKVNLGLRVLGRRTDGYHRLRTLLVGIDLRDSLTFEPGGDGVTLECDDPTLPVDDGNLVLRAAALLGPGRSARIRLEKRIPAGRGLGGGSADAAGTLVALNRIWNLGLRERELGALAARIGMDVPYFLEGGAALGVGRGEALYPLGADPELHLALVLPSFGISTPDAYRGLVGKVPAPSDPEPSGDVVVSGLGRVRLANDLERSEALARCPNPHAVPHIRSALASAGALASAMSGSGSAVFGVFADREAARRGAAELTGRGMRALPVRTLSRREHLAGLAGTLVP